MSVRIRRVLAVALLALLAATAGPVPAAAQTGDDDAPADLRALEAAAQAAPGDVEARLRLAGAYESGGQRDAAIAAYRAALALDASRNEARKALERLGAIGWSDQDALARAEKMLGERRYGEAAYLFERFLRDHPDDARARAGLERARAGLDGTVAPAPAAQTAPAPVPSAPPAESDSARLEAAGEIVPSGTGEAAQAVVPAPIAAVAAAVAPPADEPAAAPPASERTVDPIALQRPLSETPSSSGDDLPVVTLVLSAAGAVALLGTAIVIGWRRSRRRRAPTIEGTLDRFPLPDVLQLIAMGGRDGTLEIRGDDGSATLVLGEGRFQQASCGKASGREAIFAALALAEGSFRFFAHPLPARMEPRIEMPVQQALLEWAEAQDESRRDDDDARLLAALDDPRLSERLPF